jgi:hypothetical protein
MADENKPELKPIRFLQKQSPYNAGEVAGFPHEVAQRYVDAKLAEFYDAKKDAAVSGEEIVLEVAGEKLAFEEEPASAAEKGIRGAGRETQIPGAKAAGEEKSSSDEGSDGSESAAGAKKAGAKK